MHINGFSGAGKTTLGNKLEILCKRYNYVEMSEYNIVQNIQNRLNHL